VITIGKEARWKNWYVIASYLFLWTITIAVSVPLKRKPWGNHRGHSLLLCHSACPDPKWTRRAAAPSLPQPPTPAAARAGRAAAPSIPDPTRPPFAPSSRLHQTAWSGKRVRSLGTPTAGPTSRSQLKADCCGSGPASAGGRPKRGAAGRLSAPLPPTLSPQGRTGRSLWLELAPETIVVVACVRHGSYCLINILLRRAIPKADPGGLERIR